MITNTITQIVREIVAKSPDPRLRNMLGERIRPTLADAKDPLPHLAVLTDTTKFAATHDGPSNFMRPVVMLVVHADTKQQAADISFLIRQRMHALFGFFGGHDLRPALVEGEEDVIESAIEGRDTPVYVAQSTVSMMLRKLPLHVGPTP